MYTTANPNKFLQELKWDNIEIHPNPCQNTIGVHAPKTTNGLAFSISDLNGKILLEGDYSEQIDVSGLLPGNYIIKLNNGSSQTVRKFLKR